MIRILAAIGLGSALMLAPALALADDAPKPEMMAKPMVHHRHHHHMMKPVVHHHRHHHMMKKMEEKKMDEKKM
ncbi:MAG: hypothetical protein ABSG83_01640 [Roseiarcus sp.]|jgi:hypothetical protein